MIINNGTVRETFQSFNTVHDKAFQEMGHSMTGIEVIRNPDTTVEQIATVISGHCPPVVPEDCDHLACRDCWLAWLTQEQPVKEQMVHHIFRDKRDINPLVPQGPL